jgi:phage virion morphogenesis protein
MILQDTGALKRSITPAHGRNYAEVGTPIVYAAIHQFGGETGRNHATTIRARPFFYVSSDGWDAIDDAVTNYLTDLKL